MNIETKFNLMQKVWFMKNNQPIEVEISCVKTFNTGSNQDRITYNAKDIVGSVSWLDHEHLHEYMLFESKNKLMLSLFDKQGACKGRNCTAVNGEGHSKECIDDHDEICANLN